MKSSINKLLAIAVILLLLINTVLLVFIWKEKEKPVLQHPQGNGGPFETMVKELNMTEQQKNDYKKLRDEHFAKVRPLFDSIRQIRSSLFKLVKDSTANDDSVSFYSKRIAEKQAIIDKLTLTHFQKVRKLFAPDQQIKFDEFMQKMIQRRRDTTNRH